MFQTDPTLLRSIFNAYDSDGDSVLSFEEFSPEFCYTQYHHTGTELYDPCAEFWFPKIWNMCDTDNSVYDLNIDEFGYLMNWFGDIFARLIIKVRKQPSFVPGFAYSVGILIEIFNSGF